MLRLIGHAQAGRVPTEELALQREYTFGLRIFDLHKKATSVLTGYIVYAAGPLPKFEGLNVTVPPPRTADGAVSPPPSAGGPARVPPLNPDDVNKFYSLFEKSDVQGGILSGTSTGCGVLFMG